MLRDYWRGVALGSVPFVMFLGYGVYQRAYDGPGIVIDPPIVDRSDSLVLPGRPVRFTVVVQNRSFQTAWIDELRFSSPCASGIIGDSISLPMRLAPFNTVPIHVTVRSENGESRILQLQFSAHGRIGSRNVDTGAAATLCLAQPLNAEPPFIALGEISKTSQLLEKSISLWVPSGSPVPSNVSIESDDPCISGTIVKFADSAEHASGSNVRNVFAKLLIRIDPAKAPERLRAGLLLKWQDGEIVVPILGFVVGQKSGVLQS